MDNVFLSVIIANTVQENQIFSLHQTKTETNTKFVGLYYGLVISTRRKRPFQSAFYQTVEH